MPGIGGKIGADRSACDPSRLVFGQDDRLEIGAQHGWLF